MADLTALPMIGSLIQPITFKTNSLVEFFPFLGDWIVPDGKAMLTSKPGGDVDDDDNFGFVK